MASILSRPQCVKEYFNSGASWESNTSSNVQCSHLWLSTCILWMNLKMLPAKWSQFCLRPDIFMALKGKLSLAIGIFSLMRYVTWWPLLWLLSRYLILFVSFCISTENQVPVYEFYRQINDLQMGWCVLTYWQGTHLIHWPLGKWNEIFNV